MIVLGAYGVLGDSQPSEILPTFEQETYHTYIQRCTSVPINLQNYNTNEPIFLVQTFLPTLSTCFPEHLQTGMIGCSILMCTRTLNADLEAVGHGWGPSCHKSQALRYPNATSLGTTASVASRYRTKTQQAQRNTHIDINKNPHMGTNFKSLRNALGNRTRTSQGRDPRLMETIC